MGSTNCCTKREYELRSEDLFANIILSFQLNEYSYFEMLKKLKCLSIHDCIKVKDFMKFIKRYFSSDSETKLFQEEIFNKYFTLAKVTEINIYEVMLILLPYLNYNDNKVQAIKDIVTYLGQKRYLKTKREVITFYYSFNLIFITKAVGYFISQDSYLKVKYADILFEIKFNLSEVFNEANVDKEINHIFNFEKESLNNNINSKTMTIDYFDNNQLQLINSKSNFENGGSSKSVNSSSPKHYKSTDIVNNKDKNIYPNSTLFMKKVSRIMEKINATNQKINKELSSKEEIIEKNSEETGVNSKNNNNIVNNNNNKIICLEADSLDISRNSNRKKTYNNQIQVSLERNTNDASFVSLNSQESIESSKISPKNTSPKISVKQVRDAVKLRLEISDKHRKKQIMKVNKIYDNLIVGIFELRNHFLLKYNKYRYNN